MIPLICMYTGGILTLLMAIIHTRYHKMFNWKSEFEKISTAVARIFNTLHVALILMFIIIGVISIAYAGELSKSTGLANTLNILLAVFWIWRLIWQFLYFKIPKGQKPPVIVIVLSIIFLLLAISYSIPFFDHLLK